ncbi:unnamed protein product [Rhizophagus irregularis]|nr:unnamed protein product [Rhizophagus irregularis]
MFKNRKYLLQELANRSILHNFILPHDYYLLNQKKNCSKKLLIPRDRSSWFYFSIFSYISIVISEMIKITKEVNPIHGD